MTWRRKETIRRETSDRFADVARQIVTPLLEVHDLSCGYAGVPVMEHVGFAVERGDVLAILGPNGVGKTTLFKTVLGLLPALGGKVLLDGETLDTRPDGPQMRRVAYVPQAHAPAFAFTVGEMVLMGRTALMGAFATPSEKDREATCRVLGELGLAELYERPYTQISGGQRQMVLIARALVREPDVLVMDEPASSLDLGNQARLLTCVRDLAGSRGLAVLMTTHSPDHALLVANKALLFGAEDGPRFGTVSEVLNAHALSRAYDTPVRVLEGDGLRSCVLDLTMSHGSAVDGFGPAAVQTIPMPGGAIDEEGSCA